jgi:hypothetical protein
MPPTRTRWRGGRSRARTTTPASSATCPSSPSPLRWRRRCRLPRRGALSAYMRQVTDVPEASHRASPASPTAWVFLEKTHPGAQTSSGSWREWCDWRPWSGGHVVAAGRRHAGLAEKRWPLRLVRLPWLPRRVASTRRGRLCHNGVVRTGSGAPHGRRSRRHHRRTSGPV